MDVGDHVMKGSVKGKAWKFSRPYHGPYRVVAVTSTNAEVKLMDDPTADSIFVSLDRVHRCYPELPDHSWTGNVRDVLLKHRIGDSTPVPYTGPVIRARARNADNVT